MKRLLFAVCAGLCAGFCASGAALAEPDASAADAASPEVSGNLVMFLTQTDPMLAGHGLHFGARMASDGRGATVILVGDAGRLALAGWPANASAVSGKSLQADLEAFIEAGGRAYITPYTLSSFDATPDDLIKGVSLPDNPAAIHAHMFEPDTQLLVW